jgi:phospholipase C
MHFSRSQDTLATIRINRQVSKFLRSVVMPLARIMALLLGVSLISGCSMSSLQSPFGSAPGVGAHRHASSSPIQHIVIIMQENRSFDNMFYQYPGANYATQGMGKKGTVYPLKPIDLGWLQDMNHYHYQFLEDYDKGKNDGFDQQIVKNNGTKNCTPLNWVNQPHCFQIAPKSVGVQPYTYVIQSQIQPYWDMAKQYVLGDNTFASNNGPTFVSHQYLIAGQAAHASEVPSSDLHGWGCDTPPSAYEWYMKYGSFNPPWYGPKYGNEYQGPIPCFPLGTSGPSETYNTIANELDTAGVSWRWYVQPESSKNSWWLNAWDAVKSIRNGPDWSNGDISMPDTNVITDIQNNDLQQVTWVMPHGGASDHPGSGSNFCGPNWVAAVVNAIGQSQYWNNTAIIVMWDEWGGWYDHVLPHQYADPQTGAYEGLGYRIPLLIVSPYAKAGYISHQPHEIASTLHFIEQTFGLPPLGQGTKNKWADQRADAFDDAFDFTQQPITFKPIQLVKEPDPQNKFTPCPTNGIDFVKQTWGPESDY